MDIENKFLQLFSDDYDYSDLTDNNVLVLEFGKFYDDDYQDDNYDALNIACRDFNQMYFGEFYAQGNRW